MGIGAIRLLAIFAGGLFLMLIGFEGNPGSVLGSIIDPASMTEQSGKLSNSLVPGSGTLTAYQIGLYAQGAGFTGDLAIAIAIALAESGGSVAAKNTKNPNGTIDYGLWQINSVHSQYDPTRLLTDPAYNAAAAFAIYKSWNGFGAWSTYNNGAYQAKLAEATLAANQIWQTGGGA